MDNFLFWFSRIRCGIVRSIEFERFVCWCEWWTNSENQKTFFFLIKIFSFLFYQKKQIKSFIIFSFLLINQSINQWWPKKRKCLKYIFIFWSLFLKFVFVLVIIHKKKHCYPLNSSSSSSSRKNKYRERGNKRKSMECFFLKFVLIKFFSNLKLMNKIGWWFV